MNEYLEYIINSIHQKKFNDLDTFFGEIEDDREFLTYMNDEGFAKSVEKFKNQYLFDSLQFDKIDKTKITPNQLSIVSYIKGDRDNIKNKYISHIYDYYHACGKKLPEDVFEQSKILGNLTKDYYSGKASIIRKDEEFPKLPALTSPKFETNANINAYYINYITNVGSIIKMNSKGFGDNKYIYFIYGLIIIKARLCKFQKFSDLLDFIIKHLQLLPFNKIFKAEDVINQQKNYNLITYILNENKENYRYMNALKYFNEYSQDNFKKMTGHNSKTKFNKDDKNAYIYTELTLSDIKELSNTFEELYKAKDFKNLVKVWFDSQYLTRSTCAVGCLLIEILFKELYTFKQDELPDWATIAGVDIFKTCLDVLNGNIPEEINDYSKKLNIDMIFKIFNLI